MNLICVYKLSDNKNMLYHRLLLLYNILLRFYSWPSFSERMPLCGVYIIRHEARHAYGIRHAVLANLRLTTWAADIFGRFHEPQSRNLCRPLRIAFAEARGKVEGIRQL